MGIYYILNRIKRKARLFGAARRDLMQQSGTIACVSHKASSAGPCCRFDFWECPPSEESRLLAVVVAVVGVRNMIVKQLHAEISLFLLPIHGYRRVARVSEHFSAELLPRLHGDDFTKLVIGFVQFAFEHGRVGRRVVVAEALLIEATDRLSSRAPFILCRRW